MITIENLHKKFDQKYIINNISLSITEGEIVCLLGRSGSGKSTLLRIISGLIKPDAGTIRVATNKVALVFQEPRLLPWLTVEENLRLALPWRQSLYKKKIQILEILKELHLTQCEALMPRELSGGMAQRVGLARALLRKSNILLLDEPFSSLDALTRSDLQILFKKLITHHKKTCLFVTHDIDEALFFSDKIFILHEGHLYTENIFPLEKTEAKKRILCYFDKELLESNL